MLTIFVFCETPILAYIKEKQKNYRLKSIRIKSRDVADFSKWREESSFRKLTSNDAIAKKEDEEETIRDYNDIIEHTKVVHIFCSGMARTYPLLNTLHLDRKSKQQIVLPFLTKMGNK